MQPKNKTIIAIYGRQNEGKSETIKKTCKLFLDNFPTATSSPIRENIDYSKDILVEFIIDGVKLGFESQGDPNGKQFDTINNLANNGCYIIVCASRTKGETTHLIDNIANQHNYHTVWISSFFSPLLNSNTLNIKASENLLEIIKSLMTGQISEL